MKRSCETCLWWDWDGDALAEQRRGNCRYSDPPSHFLPAVWPVTLAADWCYKWEPRDRSLIRCETCEWFLDEEGGQCQLNPPSSSGSGCGLPYAAKGNKCSHWRLREEQGDV